MMDFHLDRIIINMGTEVFKGVCLLELYCLVECYIWECALFILSCLQNGLCQSPKLSFQKCTHVYPGCQCKPGKIERRG